MRDSNGKKNRPLLGFYILVAYVILQYSWWAYLLFSLNNEIYHLKTELNIIKATSLSEATQLGNELQNRLHVKWAMIIGEGTVFFTLLIAGIFITRSSFKKENALSKQQRNFMLSVTHELRSPLASARLQVETLSLRHLNRDKQLEIIAGALNDIDRLNGLVENILLAARIENSNFPISRERVDLTEFIFRYLDKQKLELRDDRKIDLDIEGEVFAEIDRFSFPSILFNLYENAVKYSSPGSTIRIKLLQQNNKILLSIADEGIGISSRDKELIFKKFYRAGREETRKTQGTGLGLYIVKYLCKVHGGMISVRDNLPKGSIFELSLPKSS